MNGYCILCAQNEGVTALPVADHVDRLGVRCTRCGGYMFDHVNADALMKVLEGRKHLVSGALRHLNEKGLVDLTAESIPQLLSTVPSWTLSQQMDALLLFLADRTERYWSPVQYDRMKDYPLVYMRDERDMNSFVVEAEKLGYLDLKGDSTKITSKGWAHIEELRTVQPKATQAFVAMWFDDSVKDAWLNGLKPGIEDSGYYKAFRIDSVEHNEKIDDRIITEIRRSGLVVADFTGDRGGVYFEAGYARGLDIPVIWTCRKDWIEKVHFDTNHFNYITWETSAELRTKLDVRIRATVLPRR